MESESLSGYLLFLSTTKYTRLSRFSHFLIFLTWELLNTTRVSFLSDFTSFSSWHLEIQFLIFSPIDLILHSESLSEVYARICHYL